MSTDRFRLRFTFWLDMLKGEEAEIAKRIAKLKDERSFSQTIRDGIRLICDLKAGKLDVLFELFPWVRVEFLKHMEDIQPKTIVSNTALAPDVEKYLQEILEKLDKPQAAPTALQPLNGNSSGLKPLGGLQPIGGARSIAAPSLGDTDDIKLTVEKVKSEPKDGLSVNQRFIAQMQGFRK